MNRRWGHRVVTNHAPTSRPAQWREINAWKGDKQYVDSEGKAGMRGHGASRALAFMGSKPPSYVANFMIF
jgi:hypothetical protein